MHQQRRLHRSWGVPDVDRWNRPSWWGKRFWRCLFPEVEDGFTWIHDDFYELKPVKQFFLCERDFQVNNLKQFFLCERDFQVNNSLNFGGGVIKDDDGFCFEKIFDQEVFFSEWIFSQRIVRPGAVFNRYTKLGCANFDPLLHKFVDMTRYPPIKSQPRNIVIFLDK